MSKQRSVQKLSILAAKFDFKYDNNECFEKCNERYNVFT